MAATVPSFDFIFHYLITHDLDQAKDFLDPGWNNKEPFELEHPIHTFGGDLKGTVTLSVPNGPMTVTVEKIATFKVKNLILLPGTQFKALDKAPGTLFVRPKGKVPTGCNDCFVSQFPPRDSKDQPGRTVVEFYTPCGITGVFKTDVDNYGALGKGEWEWVDPNAA